MLFKPKDTLEDDEGKKNDENVGRGAGLLKGGGRGFLYLQSQPHNPGGVGQHAVQNVQQGVTRGHAAVSLLLLLSTSKHSVAVSVNRLGRRDGPVLSAK